MKKEETATGKSALPVKLLVRRKGFEIVAEGTISSLYSELDALTDFTNKVAEKFELIEEAPSAETEAAPSAEEIAKTPAADIPVINARKSTIENLDLLFATPWGRTPRVLAEIIKALQINAVPDSAPSVSRDLARLVRRGTLRRIEKEGKYAYFRLPE